MNNPQSAYCTNLAKLDLNHDLVYFLPLGGAGEIGMNFYLYSFSGEWLIVDIGITFADDTTPPGIEIIVPDISALNGIQEKIVGIVITHAHEDHLGAIGYLWPKLRCPVFLTGFAFGIVEKKLGEMGLLSQVDLVLLNQKSIFQIGSFDLEYVSATHSVPESNFLLIKVNGLTIFHTGDWKLDPNPLEGSNYDDKRLFEIGEHGVDLLIGDSTNAPISGWSGSEAQCRLVLSELIKKQPGRVVVTCFSSNSARLASVGEAAKETGRSLAIVGRSLNQFVMVAKSNGYLCDMPIIRSAEELSYLPKEKQLILCTGSQGESRAAMAKLATGQHFDLFLEPGDTVIFSSKVIPGNERRLNRLYDQLAKLKVSVITETDAEVHVTGHPCKDELIWLYNVLKPKVIIPVHGEERHLNAHEELVVSLGGRVQQVRNGELICLKTKPSGILTRVYSGRMGLAGKTLIPLSNEAFKERKLISDSGVVSVTVVIDKIGKLMKPVKVETIGIPFDEFEYLDFWQMLAKQSEQVISDAAGLDCEDDNVIRSLLKRMLRKKIKANLGINPRKLINLIRLD